jgi:hypothetical protein
MINFKWKQKNRSTLTMFFPPDMSHSIRNIMLEKGSTESGSGAALMRIDWIVK